MANSLVQQGTLNRLKASVSLTNFPPLNVTSGYLAKEGIRLALEGESTTILQTLTGFVTSPEPYQVIRCTIHLIKAQALANAWKIQMEANTLVGDFTVRPDATPLSPYPGSNGAVTGVDPMSFAGNEPGWVINVVGIYYINSSLFN